MTLADDGHQAKPEPSASTVDIAAYLEVRTAGDKDWYLRDECGLAPYQQRQIAQLGTSSGYMRPHAASAVGVSGDYARARRTELRRRNTSCSSVSCTPRSESR